jgi:hypothetical protein
MRKLAPILVTLLAALAWSTADVAACPFCTALKPTLVQRRESAAVAAVGELVEVAADRQVYRLHKVLRGESLLTDARKLIVPRQRAVAVAATAAKDAGPAKLGSLVVLLATRTDEAAHELTWDVTPVSELGYAYFVRAPASKLPTRERLKFFAAYLEHRDESLAEDAYLEFGHAPYDEVARVADLLPMESLRKWLVDPRVPQPRKGFYGLALGLAQNDNDRRANVALLRKLVLEPADDFRAGFDGVLGGYLVAAGEPALKLIEERILANPRAAEGDVRHAQTALRFCHEFGRESLTSQQLSKAARRLLARPEFAATAIIDLARWQDWDALENIAGLFGRPGYESPETTRAVVGYLLACPAPQAARELARLRKLDSKAVADAEQRLSLLGPAR